MSEKLIETVVTKNDLKHALQSVGVKATDACLVHTAMSKLQYLPGGSETIINALEETLKDGTLMMPSQVSTNCDPATWEYPPVRKDLIQVIRDSMPPYDPRTSATEGLGLTPEYFRNLPDVVRSSHSYLPIAIWGKNSRVIAKRQPLDMPYGINSPLDYLFRHNGKTIFLGTDYDTCTMLHYVDLDSYDDFNDLGKEFEKQFPNEWQSTKLSRATIKVINVVPLINFARQWFQKKDKQFGNSID